MNKVINLNRFRKRKTRAENEKNAEQNRAKFGRTKADKKESAVEKSKLEKHLDGHETEQ